MSYLANRIERNLGILKGLPAIPTKTHCPHGHEYTPENTYWATKRDRGEERKTACCRQCSKERTQRKRFDPKVKEQERIRTARWRQRHPEKYREGYERAYQEKKQILDEARTGGCVCCGESDVACLDFHHRNGKSDKLGHIGVIRKFSEERIRAEIAKCDVLCANCHRKHHRDERQSSKPK